MGRISRLTASTGLALILVVHAGSALAQSQDVAAQGAQDVGDSGGLAEIVVTAQKRSENLQNVPIAVTALTAGDLASSNVEGQLTLPKITPNLNFTVNSSFAAAYIRGVGTQFANPGLESSVSVYFDDTYIPRASVGLFSFNDIERIEVLKGPQGTLYGRNATGGAIRIITYDPKPEFEGSARVTYGTDNRLAVEGMVNLPITDGIALRVAARHDENDGYARNAFPGSRRRLQSRNEEFYSAKLLIEPSDVFRIKLSGDYSRKDDPEGLAFFNLFPGAPEQLGAALGGCVATGFYHGCNNAQDPEIGHHIKAYGGTARVDYEVGDATISSITAYRVEKEYSTADLDATGADVQQASGRPRTKQFTQELQIASSGAGPLRYVAGLYYLWEKSGYFFTVYGGGVGPGVVLGGDGEMRARSLAPYAQVDYDISDRFTLTVGARYTKESKKLLYNHGVFGPLGPDGFPTSDGVIAPAGPCTAPGQILCEAPQDEIKFNRFTPKITLSYKPAERVLVYATYSRGFKSGGFNLPAFGSVDAVKPETLDDFEVGLKLESGNVRFNGAAFYYKYKGLQIQITDQTTGGTRVKNAAKADIKGLEGDLTWAPNRQLELGAGAGYIDTKYKNFLGDAYVPCSQLDPQPASCVAQGGLGLALLGGLDLSGNRLQNAPKFTAYVRGQFTQPLGDMGDLQLSSILNYRSKAYFDVANLFEDEKRLLLSGRISWTSADKRYSLAVYGENLTDKKYSSIKSPQAGGGWYVPAAPRQVYVQAGVRF